MTHDINTLRLWIRIAVLITAACMTSAPIIYAFFPWRSRQIGRVLMLTLTSFALAMDLSAVFSLWTPKNILIVFWTDALVLSAIALSSVSLSIVFIRALISQWRNRS